MPIGPRVEELDPLYNRLTQILAQLDLTLSALRDAINNQIASTHPRNITLWGGTLLTGRDISLDLAKLDIALSALRDAIVNGTTPTDLLAVKNQIAAVVPRNITQWGGVALTGRDISLDLAKLDIALSALRDALRGTGLKDFTTLEADVEALNTILGSRTGWAHGHITVATAGTPVQGPDQAIAPGKKLVLLYHPNNTGKIGIGNSSASANLSTGTPVILSAPGQAIELSVDNVNKVWVDASVSGEKVIWFVET